MVGATGIEPVTPAVSRQWPVFVKQTQPTNQRSFFLPNRFEINIYTRVVTPL